MLGFSTRILLLELAKALAENKAVVSEADPINDCPISLLSILSHRPDEVLQIARDHLYVWKPTVVPECWRRLFTEASLYKAAQILACVEKAAKVTTHRNQRGSNRNQVVEDGWMDEFVAVLDNALILVGAPLKHELIHSIFGSMEQFLTSKSGQLALNDCNTATSSSVKPARKKPKILDMNTNAQILNQKQLNSTTYLPNLDDASVMSLHPKLKNPISSLRRPSLQRFLGHVTTLHPQDKSIQPVKLTECINHWPVLERALWSMEHLLSRTLGGRRLVPIEIGSSYLDTDFQQKLVPFKVFLQRFLGPDIGDSMERPPKVWYLAQHDLFSQLPSLRNDIGVPDYCFVDIPEPPAESKTPPAPTKALDEPSMNAWFGPANTKTPLHTDPHHNIFAQVIGYKYVRLYAPSAAAALAPYPRPVGIDGIDMSNTSQIDVGDIIAEFEDWDSWSSTCDRAGLSKALDRSVENTPFFEAVIGPGECLFIPRGWWHYVRSLTSSFSVSFWFD